MKKEPYDKERDAAALKLIRFSNMVKMEQPGVYNRNKNKIAKAMKAIEALRFLRQEDNYVNAKAYMATVAKDTKKQKTFRI